MELPMSKVAENKRESFFSLLNGRDCMPFDEFMNWALYDQHIGYYQKAKHRVGKQEKSDFYTSTSLGSTWGELIIESSQRLLGKQPSEEFVFVEIGAEPSSSVLDGLDHPFADHQIIRLGDQLDIPKQAIVYSNEWLDAQPFKRFKFDPKESQWMELSVGLKGERLIEIQKSTSNPLLKNLPSQPFSTYYLDWPSGSISALTELIQQRNWKGVFLTFDYGLDAHTLLNDRPEGTARAYFQHKMEKNLLLNSGNQDLTCHLCWDPLEEALHEADFKNISLTNQESFLMNHAAGRIKKIFEEKSTSLDPKILALRELLHPAHLGHGMQALSAVRF
jgi:SAM-dependent MidA family methyltransferase